MRPTQPQRENLEKLKALVCEHFKVTWKQIDSSARTQRNRLTDARHVFMYLAHRQLGYGPSYLGKKCNKDHTSIIYAVQKIEGFYDIKDALILDIEIIKTKLHEA